MKSVLKTVLVIIRGIIGFFCGCFTMAYLFLLFTEDHPMIFAEMAVLFGFLTFLCFKKKKAGIPQKKENDEPDYEIQQNTPQQTAPKPFTSQPVKNMAQQPKPQQNTPKPSASQQPKSVKSMGQELSNDVVRVIFESYQIMQRTKDIRTLCKRYEFGMKKCNYLKQLESKGQFHCNTSADQWINIYTQTYYKLIKDCHDRFVSEVKTESGKKNRSKKFFAELAELVDEFTLNDIRKLIQ